jgi:hypothetical protein
MVDSISENEAQHDRLLNLSYEVVFELVTTG